VEKIGAFVDADRVTADGEWRPGDPAIGQKATPLASGWFNMLQRELLAVLADAGMDPDVATEDQLLAAIRGLSPTESLPGTIKRASEAKALAGEDNKDAMTALRVFQAFSQFGLGNQVVATEIDAGAEAYYPAGTYITPLLDTMTDVPSGLADRGVLIVDGGNGGVLQVLVAKQEKRLFYRIAFNQSNIAGTAWFEFADRAWVAEQISNKIATQQETDAGNNDQKFITPKKLQAWVKQATESVLGMMRVATLLQTETGDDDTTAVTPKKLRWGVSYSRGENGYVALPGWLGGIIFQWSGIIIASGSTVQATLPMALTTQLYAVVGQEHSSTTTGITVSVDQDSYSTTGFSVKNTASNSVKFFYFCAGK
tara:strand:- start:16188 stop:17291 length:1104 start_codon:yes stop_codon:yes gene_type:complete